MSVDVSAWAPGRVGSDGQRRSVILTEAGTITVVFDGPPEFDLPDLTPEQAWALAAMVGDMANEPLALLLLSAAGAVKPEVLS